MMAVEKHSELREAWRAVAYAKLVEYRHQVRRLAQLVRRGAIKKIDAIDALYEIAIAHGLVRGLGEDRVQAILAEAFEDVDLQLMLVAEIEHLEMV